MDTQAFIDTARERLLAAFPDVAVEYFPAAPADYRLNHPAGALLLSYPGATFGDAVLRATGGSQERVLTLGVTLVTRHLFGALGAVALMDRLRAALVGWLPTDCHQPLLASRERLVTEQAGLWWHAVDFTFATRETYITVDSP